MKEGEIIEKPVEGSPESIPFNASPSNPKRSLKPSDVILPEEDSPRKKSFFKLIIPASLIVLTLIVASFSIYLFYKNDLVVLEERNLIAGAEIPLASGQEVDFVLANEGAPALKLLADESAGSTQISSESGDSATIYVDQTVSMDTDGDSENDLEIKLIRLEDGSLGFIFERIVELKENIDEPSDKPRVSSSSSVTFDRVSESSDDSVNSEKNVDSTSSTTTTTSKSTESKSTTTDECATLDCSSDQKCGYASSDSKELTCVYKTCEDHGGSVCSESSVCSGDSLTLSRDDGASYSCCKGSCVVQDGESNNLDSSDDRVLQPLSDSV